GGLIYCFFVFFFQAEDGIRDFHVTGVQTCALPIFDRRRRVAAALAAHDAVDHHHADPRNVAQPDALQQVAPRGVLGAVEEHEVRSEERRVGKEWRAGWWPNHLEE